jgi:hypothetical protein
LQELEWGRERQRGLRRVDGPTVCGELHE